MNRMFLLTWRYMTFNKVKSGILVLCVTLTLFMPIALQQIVQQYEETLSIRAEQTPLLLGAKGNRFDLTLKSLYFIGEQVDPVSMDDAEQLMETKLALVLPLHLEFSARSFPLVGTTLDYFEFRKLTLQSGTLPLQLGDAVIGATVAKTLQLKPGDTLLTDQTSLYDLAAIYPLRMHVTGVLSPQHTPDDRAVFTDLKTTWVVQGIGHGHVDLRSADDDSVLLASNEDALVANAALKQYTEITPQNMGSFHFHGAPKEFPISSIIVLPDSQKSSTLLKGRYNLSTTTQLIVPRQVIEELMHIVFKVKRFFDANFMLVSLVSGLFVGLVILLSLRLRQNERQTMFKMGCSRATVYLLQSTELFMVVIVSFVLALIGSGILSWFMIHSENLI